MPLPKVLMVEDESLWHYNMRRLLDGKAELLSARTLEDGERLFRENPDVAIVLMDGCVPGDKLNTLPLIGHIRTTFTGPLVAISGAGDFLVRMVESGCSHKCHKDGLEELLPKLLGF